MMKFVERMERMIKADAHGVLDRLEERSLLLKQHLREAEIEVQHKRAEVELLQEEERRLEAETSRIADEVAALDEDVELALSGDKEDLARFAIRRLLAKRATGDLLTARRADVAERRARLEERLEVQSRQLEELRTRVRAQLAAAKLAEEQGEPAWAEGCTADEEIDLELLRRRRTREAGAREGLR